MGKTSNKAVKWRGAPQLRERLVELDKLRPDPKNARRHTERNVEAIRRSLESYGQRKAVVVRKGQIVAGHGTAEAAKLLGWTHLAAVTADDLTEAQAREYAVLDNRAPELAEWDTENLLQQLDGFSSPEALGFSAEDLAAFRVGDRFVPVMAKVDSLKAHPQNYQTHPEDQLKHIQRSIELHGYYRNVVVARDNTILAGHGVVEASKKMGKKFVPVVRLDLDPGEPRALKVMTSDNEISNMAVTDDRALTELLKEIMATDGLDGTGFDPESLAAMAFVTRPESEILDKNEAAEWVGMPEYEAQSPSIKLWMNFASAEDRADFLKRLGLDIPANAKSAWWPPRGRDDVESIKFEA